ncbi:PREDICTED: sodium-independent sulfate anion transporter [Nicrophorus vespilloides]|uniref:Sodium-independent sulfate anion transporter n=1 Tax=Nicrophorus vespilloides TaxID=110193 RepID=A0ABM1NDY7_NICVS|nr:PREDICTED: sodium-independent sulfate anion transporter [Nicrophorus vespilloides]
MDAKMQIGRVIQKRIPIIGWAKNYNSEKALSDLIAGITVGLTVMPQALAYATLAGLEPQYGLYSAFAGTFVYAIFGSCKDIAIGPTALMALMTYQQIVNKNTDYAILLCFLSGIVQLFMAVLNLGVLIDFISIPVTVGFTSATSVIIAASQFKGMLGLKFTSSGFLDTMSKVYKNIHETRYQDLTMSLICITVLLALRKLKDVRVSPIGVKQTKNQRYISKALWLISTARNALIVIVCSVVAYLYEASGSASPFILTGNVKQGLPPLGLPPFSTNMNNRTIGFTEMVADLGGSVVMVPVIAVLGNVAIAKAFASGNCVDATQELFTLALCNIFGSFFCSMPITGSFSRSAVNHASGVRTPIGGLYTGFMVLLALSFLTPYFAFIPKAALAAVIICAVIFMIEYEVIRPMWRSSRKELIPTFATFILCLTMGVELGIVIGVGINIVLLLYPSARPSIIVEKMNTRNGIEYILVTPGNSLYFPAVDFIKTNIDKVALDSKHQTVVVDCKFILGADFTAAKGIAAMIQEFSSRKQLLYFLNPREEVLNVFRGASLEDFRHINSITDLEKLIGDEFSSEQIRLLPENELPELREISYCDLNHRKKSVA